MDFPKVKLEDNPYPHVVIDNFLPTPISRDIARRFPKRTENWYRYDNVFEKKWAQDDLEFFEPEIAATLQFFNNAQTLRWLEKITGISGLIPDPYFRGGGCHQIERGGKLDIHADFNFHKKLNLHRRLNMLYYCTYGWKEEWGGHLELWEKDMSRCAKRIAPLFNRLVIFETNDDSFHGHPEPLNCPSDVTRNSLAFYYYTATRPIEQQSAPHSTMFMKRPNEKTTREIELLRKKRNMGRLK